MFEETVEPDFVDSNRPSYEDIASLAHALWEQRGCPIGSPEEDWFQAERQLQAKDKQEGAQADAVSA